MEGEDVTWDTVVIPGVEDTLSLEVIQHQPVSINGSIHVISLASSTLSSYSTSS
ncbi:hypothetical protein DPMN_143338 [Dreissena polymorpha]|uniref:Uncharacterized protein n=1 Tax=Dreissena polymorpha TaxID=45954 RepID=A0A9D4GCZ3_DREPO|nr:hypothetical protein DPMN_143338 [Dreissena polymorpha]